MTTLSEGMPNWNMNVQTRTNDAWNYMAPALTESEIHIGDIIPVTTQAYNPQIPTYRNCTSYIPVFGDIASQLQGQGFCFTAGADFSAVYAAAAGRVGIHPSHAREEPHVKAVNPRKVQGKARVLTMMHIKPSPVAEIGMGNNPGDTHNVEHASVLSNCHTTQAQTEAPWILIPSESENVSQPALPSPTTDITSFISAREWRHRILEQVKFPGLPEDLLSNPKRYVDILYKAMKDMTSAEDGQRVLANGNLKRKSPAYRMLESDQYHEKDIIATCWLLVEMIIKLHQEGSSLRGCQLTDPGRHGSSELDLTFMERFEAVEWLLKTEKMAAKDVIDGNELDSMRTVRCPISIKRDKSNYRKLNDRRLAHRPFQELPTLTEVERDKEGRARVRKHRKVAV